MISLADAIFVGLAALTLIGAALAVTMRNVFHNALALILCLFGVASLFIYLNCEFLAVMEVIIYIGAISIAIIFAIMLSRPMFQKFTSRQPEKVARAALIAAFFWIGLVQTLRHTSWASASTDGDYSIAAIGQALLSSHALPFEAVSLVLLVAIVGALALSSDTKASR